MKVAFFTPTLNAGGYEKVVISFANEFSRYPNVSVLILCGDDTGKLRETVNENVQIKCLHCRARGLLIRIMKFLYNNEVDILYTGFRIYNTIAVCAKILTKNNVKICASQHGYEENSGIKKWIFGKIIGRADLLVGVTKGVLSHEVKELQLGCKSVVIGNPVINKYEIEHVDLECQNFKDTIIVTCGRLSSDKNYSLAIDILKYLKDKGHEYKLLMIGNGPEKKILEKQIIQYNLEESVKMVGYVSQPISYMKQGTVYLHTCDKEGFGNTVVEAMYAGLPVVTTECGGPVELIENDKYGICFGNGRDIEAVKRGAEAIINVVQNKSSYNNQQKKALQYSASEVSKLLLEEFKVLL